MLEPISPTWHRIWWKQPTTSPLQCCVVHVSAPLTPSPHIDRRSRGQSHSVSQGGPRPQALQAGHPSLRALIRPSPSGQITSPDLCGLSRNQATRLPAPDPPPHRKNTLTLSSHQIWALNIGIQPTNSYRMIKYGHLYQYCSNPWTHNAKMVCFNRKKAYRIIVN